MKILVVDDSRVTRKIIKTVAAALRIETREAQDGNEALDTLRRFRDEIDLVLLDWGMPLLSGYDVLLAIKNDSSIKHIPVMMVTAESQKTSIVAAIRAGADNYLTKPFTVEELEQKLIEFSDEEAGYL